MNGLRTLKLITVFICETIQEKLISTGYMKTGEQLSDLLTKALNGPSIECVLISWT